MQHQIYSSEGVGLDTVNVTDRSVFGFTLSGTTHAGIRVGSNGTLFQIQNNGGFSAINGEWLVSGTPSTFYVTRTIISGTLQVDAGAGPLQCNVNRDYDNQVESPNVKVAVIRLDFSDDISGLPIIGSAVYTFQAG